MRKKREENKSKGLGKWMEGRMGSHDRAAASSSVGQRLSFCCWCGLELAESGRLWAKCGRLRAGDWSVGSRLGGPRCTARQGLEMMSSKVKGCQSVEVEVKQSRLLAVWLFWLLTGGVRRHWPACARFGCLSMAPAGSVLPCPALCSLLELGFISRAHDPSSPQQPAKADRVSIASVPC
jgi:hypothetical protein